MQPPNVCPSAADLQRLLLGLVDDWEAGALEDHLSQCSSCAEQAFKIPAEDGLVHAMRTPGPAVTTPPELVNVLLPLLKRLNPDPAVTASWSGTVPSNTTPIPSHSGLAILAPPAEPNELGRLGPYAIHEVLGAGGMGVVFRGFDPRLQRPIAVKVVRPDLVARPGMVERFVQEAQAIARVEHDNIVGIHAVENHDGVPCIVMPLLRGQSLEQRLRSAKGPLPLAEVLKIGGETAAGLAAAHERGLIHRDIKPANLWLEEMGRGPWPVESRSEGKAQAVRVKILDFGLAFVRAEEGGGPSGISGTPGYLSPEQACGQPVDHRADLFSLGCVLYRMATGSPPFPDAKTFTALVRVVVDRPKPAAEVNPLMPPALTGLIEKLMAKDPTARFTSAVEVAQALTAIENAFTDRRKRVTRRRWLVAVVGAAAIGGFGAWAILDGKAKPSVPPKLVKVTFTCDADAPRIVLIHDGKEQVVELENDMALDLKPGDYSLRPVDATPGRELVPNQFILLPDEPLTVKIALVGEVERTAAHTQPITGIAVVRGKERFTVLSSSLDQTLGWWEPRSKAKTQFTRLTSPARCLAVTSDGALAATAGGNKRPPAKLAIQLWDPRTLEAKGEPLEGHTRLVTAAVFAPDGKRLLSATADEIFVWDLLARTKRAFERQTQASIPAAAFHANGKRALTGDEDGRLVLWDVEAGKSLREIEKAHARAIRACLFTPKGFVTAGDDGIIRIWDGTTFKARDLPARENAVQALALSPDGSWLLSGGADGTVRLWSIADGQLLYTLIGHAGAVRAVRFSPSGRQALSGGDDNTVRLWQLPF